MLCGSVTKLLMRRKEGRKELREGERGEGRKEREEGRVGEKRKEEKEGGKEKKRWREGGRQKGERLNVVTKSQCINNKQLLDYKMPQTEKSRWNVSLFLEKKREGEGWKHGEQ